MLHRITLSLLALCLSGFAYGASSSVSYTEPRAAGLKLRVVTVNLQDPDVRVSVILGGNRLARSESFPSMMRRAAPTAAITGTFFSTRSLLPTGDIVIGGQLAWFGSIGTGVAFGPGNQVRFVDTRYGRHTDWSGFHTVLCGGPRLVRQGKRWVFPKAEGFRDPSLFTPRIRTAIGLRRDGRLLMVAVLRPVTLSRLARAMLALGAYEAMAMDGGSSTGLYYRGSYIAQPRRGLTNVLAIYDSEVRYTNAAPGIRPLFMM